MSNIVRYFRLNFVESRFAPFLLALVVLIMRVALFLHKGLPEYAVHDTGFVWKYIAPFFDLPRISFIFSTIFVYLMAFLTSQINLRFGIIRARTHLPFSAPLILFSLHPFFLRMTPDFLAMFFILWALFPLLESHQRSYPQRYAYQSGMLLAFAGIFQIYALLFLPFWWRGGAMMSRFNLKALFSSIFGAILVYWFTFAIYLFTDNLFAFTQPFLLFTPFPSHPLPSFPVSVWSFWIFLAIFVVGFIIADYRYFSRDKVITQKTFIFITLLLACSIALQIVYRNQSFLWIYLIITFLALIMAHFYTLAALRWDIYSFFVILGLIALLYSMNFFSDFLKF